MKVCLYPGSFDPITNGHVEIALRARKIFDKVIICVANNTQKKYSFTLKERIEMIKETFKDYDGFEVTYTEGLVVDKAKEVGATCLIRGLRAVTDYEYEFMVHSTNEFIDKNIETIFFMASKEYSFLSSSTIKELHLYGADISSLVPKSVIKYWNKK